MYACIVIITHGTKSQREKNDISVTKVKSPSKVPGKAALCHSVRLSFPQNFPSKNLVGGGEKNKFQRNPHFPHTRIHTDLKYIVIYT